MIGKAKTGKTTLARTIADKLGLVYVSFAEIVTSFVQEHQDVEILHILNDLKLGKILSDEQTVKLLTKRLRHYDCQTHGWVLDGMPHTKSQAELLNKSGIIPVRVFALSLNDIEIKKRVLKTASPEY